jgi:hypothetical protein
MFNGDTDDWTQYTLKKKQNVAGIIYLQNVGRFSTAMYFVNSLTNTA